MKASVRQLRIQSKLIMGEIARGNKVTVTYRGKNFAKIVPFEKKTSHKTQRPPDVFGMWKSNKKVKSIKKFIDTIRGSR